MKINELTELLIKQTNVVRPTTCDVLICGDGEKTVNKVATCFKATVDVIKKAASVGADLLICHEPVFYGEETKETENKIAVKKWELIEKTGISIFRYHDYAHEMEPDYIHKGFSELVGLDINGAVKYDRVQLGIRKYDLNSPIRLKDLVSDIKTKLNVPCVRVAGETDMEVKSVILGLGGTMWTKQFEQLDILDADVFITGEVGEVLGCEYIRDTVAFGGKKAVIALGHYGSEYAGMKYLADDINKRFVPAEYIDCGECFVSF